MRFSRFAIPGLALLALAGCTTPKVSNCPAGVILADASQMAVFRPGAAQDLSGESYRVGITAIRSDCDIDKKSNRVVSSPRVEFRATRAPTADPAHYTVPYFMAVTQADQLIEKRILAVSFDFAPGASVATFSVSPDDFAIVPEPGHLPIEYEVMTGLQMTQAQIDYIKKMGAYAP